MECDGQHKLNNNKRNEHRKEEESTDQRKFNTPRITSREEEIPRERGNR